MMESKEVEDEDEEEGLGGRKGTCMRGVRIMRREKTENEG